jgi:hypothetical protein
MAGNEKGHKEDYKLLEDPDLRRLIVILVLDSILVRHMTIVLACELTEAQNPVRYWSAPTDLCASTSLDSCTSLNSYTNPGPHAST